MACVDEAPMRSAPQDRAERRSSRVRMPPDAFTPTDGGQEVRINLTACSVAPPAAYVPSARFTNPKPVDVVPVPAQHFPESDHRIDLRTESHIDSVGVSLHSVECHSIAQRKER